MLNSIAELLKKSRIFAALDEEARLRLASKLIPRDLQKGEVLFYQGDPSDSIYLLVSGMLSAQLTTAAGENRIIGHVDPDETVGELGALSNDPRSLTITALKDSALLQLPAKDFVEFCNQYPAIMFATLHPIIARSKNLLQLLSAEKTHKHIVLVPANKEMQLEPFCAKLMALTQRFSNVLVISDFDARFNGHDVTRDQIRQIIKEETRAKKPARVFYILKTHDTQLAKIAFKKVDAIYISAISEALPKIDKHVLDKIAGRRAHLRSGPSLVLVHQGGRLQTRHISMWLAQCDFALYHHVRMDVSPDFQRLLRFMRGRAVGVVLSGGGTRGWAHVGAIKALRESKIPIDIIGGTSVGAIVAASYAMHLSYDEAYDKFFNIVKLSKRSVSFRSLTWPAISWFSGKNFTRALVEGFGDQKIEELCIPYFCISCNLTKTLEEVHRMGMLWEKTRASASIPGLIPPMVINGELHLDGGLFNNLPVDVMRQMVGKKGRIIAVELNSFAPHRHKYFFPPVLTFLDALFSKIGFGKKYKFPRFTDTFLRGLFVGSISKTRQNSLAANTFISVSLTQFRLLYSNLKQSEHLVKLGYEDTMKQIQEGKKLNVTPESDDSPIV